jgi:adenylate cyclase
VFPLFAMATRAPASFLGPTQAEGREQEVAILFADLRDFTRLAEQRLPYDVVFILNEYFAAMGAAVERAGGYLDKFVGDGVMALFGLDSEVQRGCRQALQAAVAMARSLDELNRVLVHDLREPLQMGIGIHSGNVIVGLLGYGRVRSVTAIGDPVNIASRLEGLNKEYGSQLVVSEDVVLQAGVDLSEFPGQEIEVRGRTNPLAIRVVGTATALESALAGDS